LFSPQDFRGLKSRHTTGDEQMWCHQWQHGRIAWHVQCNGRKLWCLRGLTY
jgi:cysteinyl-tRNA synthetase